MLPLRSGATRLVVDYFSRLWLCFRKRLVYTGDKLNDFQHLTSHTLAPSFIASRTSTFILQRATVYTGTSQEYLRNLAHAINAFVRP